MDKTLVQVLQEGASRDYLLAWIEAHPEVFEDALRLAVSEESVVGWRAAWIVFHRMHANDARLQGYLGEMIRIIPGRESGHQRELLKILLRMELEEDLEGRLFDICMEIWEQVGKSSSVRSIAMQYILRVLKRYPELAGEVRFITDERFLEPLSPGIRIMVERMIAGL